MIWYENEMNSRSLDTYQRSAILLIGGFIIAGFTLRCLAAQGGLWTDEAWSLVYAQQASDALGILTRINHDNNHHLNSLWLLTVGPEAPPVLMRGLSIMTSGITILIAALIGLRRDRPTGVITAALFALSPIMVIYGSEARGYAPMMLAFMIMIWRIDIWLDDQSAPKPTFLLALCTLLGSFSHLTMLPAVAMLGLWVFLAGVGSRSVIKSAKAAADLLGPALMIAILSLCTVIIIAGRSTTGLQVGGYIPFAWTLFGTAVGELFALSTGIGYAAAPSIWAMALIGAISVAMVFTPWRLSTQRKWFYAALIVTMPLAVAVLNVGNSQYARYYLPAAIAILFLLAEWIGHFAIGQARAKVGAAIILVAILVLALVQDYQLIASQRGHPELALNTIARAAPAGAEVTIALERARATLAVAAARQRYPLRISQMKCGATDFHFVARTSKEAPSATPIKCAPTMRLVAFGDAIGPSGESWSLYQRQALPRPIAAVSSALPRQ
jgi:hypothetical protein